MIAMMTPSVIPMVLGLLDVRRQNGIPHPFAGTLGFLLGYFFAWSLFCGLATAVQWQLQEGTALRIGLHHGANCVSSCWALMIMMLAAGVMNLPWMGIMTLIVLLEKLLPIGATGLRYGTEFACLAWAGWVISCSRSGG